MGDIEAAVGRAIKQSLTSVAGLLAAITQHIKKSIGLDQARATLPFLTWGQRKAFEKIAQENMLVGDCFGRLEVAMTDLGLELIIEKATYGGLPPKEAIAIFKKKKILPKAAFDKLSDAYRAKSFTVAGLVEDYALERTHQVLTKALADGISKQQFLKTMSELYDSWGLTSKGRHHLETVFDTNVIGAYQHGRYRQQTSKALLVARPYWRYRTVGDARVRQAHKAMDGKTYPADHLIWQRWYPPNGFRCRCRIEALTQEDAGPIESDWPTVEPDQGFATSPAQWLD